MIATVMELHSIPLLTMDPFENPQINDLKNVFNLQASLNDRFQAIAALVDYFHWKRINVVGTDVNGPILAKFGEFINSKNWLLASSQALPLPLAQEEMRTVCMLIAKTGKNAKFFKF